MDLFRLCLPSTLCAPQLQSTCHYIVNHYVKIWPVRLGDANNMRPLRWGAQTEKTHHLKIDINQNGRRPPILPKQLSFASKTHYK